MQGQPLALEVKAGIAADLLCGESLLTTARRNGVSKETVRRMKLEMASKDFALVGSVTEQVRTELTQVRTSSDELQQEDTSARPDVPDARSSLSALVAEILLENLTTQKALLVAMRDSYLLDKQNIKDIVGAYIELDARVMRALETAQAARDRNGQRTGGIRSAR
jgi:hypothetical protein